MEYLEDHERTSGPLCVECHTFHVDAENDSEPCYHCFGADGVLDPCRICAGSGTELLAEIERDPDFEEEASRVRSVLDNPSKKIN
jgi:hypothetical protein